MLSRKFIIQILLGFSSLGLCLQSNSAKSQVLKDYVPPTPNAAALGKYVDMPVNLATGIPDITIPLYEVKCGSLTLPISLSYHAGGFRVEEEATWVGLGWSLLAGGAITRTILDKKDLNNRLNFFNSYDGSMLDPTSYYNFPYKNSLGAYGYDYLTHFASDDVSIDGTPDLYHFNVNGLIGKFVVINGAVKLMPKQPLIIDATGGNGNSIVDDLGNFYSFGEEESTKHGQRTSYETTSRLLTEIISPNQDTITFEYLPTEFVQGVSISEKKYYFNNGFNWQFVRTENNNAISQIKGKELSKIKFNQGEVIFESSYARDDLRNINGTSTVQGGRRLNAMKVFDKNGNLIKHYVFNYDYFESSSGAALTTEKRLKLLSVENVLSEEIFSFSYEEGIKLPAKDSKAQDHWGYFNSRNNTSLVPELNTVQNCSNGFAGFLPNREPDTIAVKANLLKQITYPTGGSTKYDYEAHDYNTVPYLDKNNGSGGPSIASAYKNVIWNASVGPESTAPDVFSALGTIVKKQCAYINLNIQEQDDVENKHPAYVSLFQDTGGSIDLELAKFREGDVPDQYMELDPGTYYLKAHASYSGDIAIGHLYYDSSPPVYLSKKWAGGVRVKKIENITGPGQSITKHIKYTLNEDTNTSSGVLLAMPEYLSKAYDFIDNNTAQTDPPTSIQCNYLEKSLEVISSNSSVILGAGHHITYSRVTEYLGAAKDQGKTVSYFTVDGNINSNGRFDQAWNRGKLLQTRIYNASGNLLRRIRNEYNTMSYEQFYTFESTIIGKHECSPDPYNPSYPIYAPRYFSQTGATIVSEYPFLEKTVETKFNSLDSIEFSTEYFYDNLSHMQPTRVVSTGAEPGIVKTLYSTYAFDYLDNIGFIQGLKTAHILKPIEQVTYQQTTSGSNLKILEGSITTYMPGINGLKYQVWQLDTDAPITYSSFKFSNNPLGYPPNSTPVKHPFGKDSRYKLSLTFDNYDLQNRPTQLTKEGDLPAALIWSKNGEHLIAQVNNAPVNQVYHTSFEDKTGWDTKMTYDQTKSYTGKISGKIVNTSSTEKSSFSNYITTSLSGNTKFKFSGWVFSGGPGAEIFLIMEKAGIPGYLHDVVGTTTVGQWVYLEKEYIVPGDITKLSLRVDANWGGDVWFDDLRLHPANARMTTYTHKPLVGNTSVSDQNNKVTHYFYDAAGRLSHIKDDKGNVLQKQEYKYHQ